MVPAKKFGIAVLILCHVALTGTDHIAPVAVKHTVFQIVVLFFAAEVSLNILQVKVAVIRMQALHPYISRIIDIFAGEIEILDRI